MAKKKNESAEEVAGDSNFENSLDELQQAVRDLESGGLSLTDSLTRYESGVKHLKQCLKLLEQTELRIRQLVDVDENGNAVLESFEHSRSSDSADPGKTGRGSKKTSATRKKSVNNDDTDDEDCDNLF